MLKFKKMFSVFMGKEAEKMILRFICILALVFFIPTMPVKAAESYGHENGKFSWSIIDDEMTLENVAGDWKITIKNDTYTIEGEKLTTPLLEYEDDEPSTDNENEWFTWYIRHPVDKLILKIKLCSRSIAQDPCLSRITALEIGKEAEIIDNNTFRGGENLKTVYVYSKNVELDNSGIGYSYFEDDVLEDLTIYGYSGSTAEAYANENGFTFIALDEPIDVAVKVDRAKVRIDEENQSVLFTTSPVDNYEGTSVSLIDGMTGEKVIDLYDDGGFQFENDGDVYMNDGCYSNYLDFSDKEIGDYSYYVQYTDENGTDCRSESVIVHVYRGFTEQELADMSKVDDAISELTNSGKFKTMKTEEKIDAVMTLLGSLEDEGLVYSIVLPENRIQIEFQYSTGVQGAILPSVFDEPIFTTTQANQTTTTTTTITTEAGTTAPTSTTGTEISTVPTTVTTPAVTTTETGTKLPQTGYSIWYQSLVAVAMGMVGIGSAVIVKSGVFRKKQNEYYF